ncbi:hypothetical protein P691DRAFT_323907 [Macrolepiota fuliginosa MF-IS2]|uniref:Uncharacterized protein n=1 Tax=Macrolepiota fuliginosa MF-IS2 TaxID=1400762 RepID=A0A9P5X8F4_9AGAR|nr:hypothetical protein P691DRAFT_323907 [Macrolepiota fuliginosa MF-IS2]
MYWSFSTGLILWVSTLFQLLACVRSIGAFTGVALYFTRGPVYVIAMLAVINDRKRCREVIERPETLSLQESTIASRIWKSIVEAEGDITSIRDFERRRSSRQG